MLMPRLRGHRKFLWLSGWGVVFLVIALWRAHEASRRAAMVDAARALGGRVSSLPFLWTEELRIHFDNAPASEVMCRELAILNDHGRRHSVTLAVHARSFAPEEVVALRVCLHRCTVICVEDAE